MSRITLRNGNATRELSHIGQDAQITEAVNGEQTIRFTVLPEDVPYLTYSTRIEFEGQWYEAESIRRYGTALGVFAEVSAEHISYRLSRMDVETISLSGTNAAVLARILSGSGLTAGSTPSGSLSAGTLENVTRREALNTAAALMGGEIEYSGASVSIVAHRGNTTRTDIMDEDSVIAVEDEGETDGENAREALTVIHGERIMDSVLVTLTGTETGVNGGGWGTAGSGTKKYFYLDVGAAGTVINDSGISAEVPAAMITGSTVAVGHRIVNSSSGRARLIIRPEGAADMTTAQFKDWLAAETPRIVYKLADCEGKTYRITLGRRGSLSVGDEIRLEYAPLGLAVNTRIISMSRNPYNANECSVEVGRHIPEITDSWAAIEQRIQRAQSAANAAQSAAQTAQNTADGVAGQLSDYVKTSEVSAKVDTYVNSDAGKASITAALSGTYAEKSELSGYEKKADLSADITVYINTQDGKASIVSACSGTYQTVAGMTGYVQTTQLNTKIEQYISGDGKASIVSACSGTYQTVSGMTGYVQTTQLNTKIEQYISGDGKASIVSACSGTYQTQSGMSSYYTKTQVDTAISQSVSPVEAAISLTASYGSGTVGSNVRALLQLVANADSSSINIKADKINFAGFTTFLRASDIGSSGSTSIDGGRILTGTISADRIDAANIKLRALYGSGTSYANVALLYSSGDDLYIGQSMSSASINVDTIKMRANIINIGNSNISQLVIDNGNKVIRHNYTANTANFDLGNSSHYFNGFYTKEIYCGDSSYRLKLSGAGIIPNTTSSSSSYFQLGSATYPFNDIYVKNVHMAGGTGSTLGFFGTTAVVRQTLSLTINNQNYSAVDASNYLHALNNLIGILKKHGLIAT